MYHVCKLLIFFPLKYSFNPLEYSLENKTNLDGEDVSCENNFSEDEWKIAAYLNI